MNPAPYLRVKGLRKSYQSVTAVDGIDLEILPGECFGVLGPNGAGKTTTMEICEGLITADSGTVEVLGLRWETNARELRKRIGVQLQETRLSEKLTVEETLRLFRSFYRSGLAIGKLAHAVQLEEKLRARLGSLSGGQKQRLAIACALVGEPDLLFLDEPTTGLDPQSRRLLWDLFADLRAAGRTIVLTTHYIEEAEHLCDRVAIMDQGKVLALGSPRALISQIGTGHTIELKVHGPRIKMSDLSSIPGVRRASCVSDTYFLEVTEPQRTVHTLLQDLTIRQIEIADLHICSATLEDVFLSITGRHLRDD